MAVLNGKGVNCFILYTGALTHRYKVAQVSLFRKRKQKVEKQNMRGEAKAAKANASSHG